MTLNIIGLSGHAGVGKDTVADVLVERCGFAKVSLADPMKRFAMQVYGWDVDTLWGSSEKRNAAHPELGGLTARHALQTLGTEWGRGCFEDTWVNIGLQTAKRLLFPALEGDAPWRYCPWVGLFLGEEFQSPYRGVVIPDIRFPNELEAIRRAGGKIVRIRRDAGSLTGAAAAHVSEKGQDAIADSAFDHVIRNVGTLDELRRSALSLADVLPARGH